MSEDTCSFCKLKDAPNQCAAFCLSALHPLFDHNVNRQHRIDTLAEGVSNSNGKLDKIEGQLQSLQTTLETLKTSMEETFQKISHTKFYTGLEEKQHTEDQSIVPGVKTKILLPGFQQIGSRYLYIERKAKQDWNTAARTCHRMGGHLASIKNEEEFTAITEKLDLLRYWSGINDRGKKDEYVSVASGKPAEFVKWIWKNIESDANCVALTKFGFVNTLCNETLKFICQQDDEN
ncbi:C-type lectin domain family 4 member F-like [Drosophila biarmipes]|uniref:C-type lectin domain family 4 member F-like n=1 Tax=Drosophila biarmipes TaxID=125945 RepID=UPI0007E6E12E|nr:C-type lectin domain family 4 member F-like [Drosophila biarmipes]